MRNVFALSLSALLFRAAEHPKADGALSDGLTDLSCDR